MCIPVLQDVRASSNMYILHGFQSISDVFLIGYYNSSFFGHEMFQNIPTSLDFHLDLSASNVMVIKLYYY